VDYLPDPYLRVRVYPQIPNVNIYNIVSGSKHVNYAVNKRFNGVLEDYQIQTANFLRELVMLSDDDLVFSNDAYFSREELDLIICSYCNG
jgi:hypothetical protein